MKNVFTFPNIVEIRVGIEKSPDSSVPICVVQENISVKNFFTFPNISEIRVGIENSPDSSVPICIVQENISVKNFFTSSKTPRINSEILKGFSGSPNSKIPLIKFIAIPNGAVTRSMRDLNIPLSDVSSKAKISFTNAYIPSNPLLNISESEKLFKNFSIFSNPKNPAIIASPSLIKSAVDKNIPSMSPPTAPTIPLSSLAKNPSLFSIASLASNPAEKIPMRTCKGKNNLVKKFLNILKNFLKVLRKPVTLPTACAPLKIFNID